MGIDHGRRGHAGADRRAAGRAGRARRDRGRGRGLRAHHARAARCRCASRGRRRHLRHRRRRRGHLQHLHRGLAGGGGAAACPWPSTATARPAGAAAAPTCWRRWACASTPPVQTVQRSLDEVGWAFLFAPGFHASTRHAVGPRKELGVRTAFNLLGPLTNPARPEAQVVGVPRPELAAVPGPLPAAAWASRAPGWCTAPASTSSRCAGPPRVAAFEDGAVRTFTVAPGGRRPRAAAPRERCAAATPRANAGIAREVLEGAPRPARGTWCVLNAAAALVVAGRAGDLREGAAQAAAAIDDGRARRAAASGCGRSRAHEDHRGRARPHRRPARASAWQERRARAARSSRLRAARPRRRGRRSFASRPRRGPAA